MEQNVKSCKDKREKLEKVLLTEKNQQVGHDSAGPEALKRHHIYLCIPKGMSYYRWGLENHNC